MLDNSCTTMLLLFERMLSALLPMAITKEIRDDEHVNKPKERRLLPKNSALLNRYRETKRTVLIYVIVDKLVNLSVPLTVHHRDHNHDNNPVDGSNWELLCVYCHDNEHSRYVDAGYGDPTTQAQKKEATHNPFADLARMLNKSK